jgi:hypothetical protein
MGQWHIPPLGRCRFHESERKEYRHILRFQSEKQEIGDLCSEGFNDDLLSGLSIITATKMPGSGDDG